MTTSATMDQILRLLPADAKEQIEVANKIILNAFTSKVKMLEDEISKQKEIINIRNTKIHSLEKRIQNVEMELSDLTEKNIQSMEDQQKLTSEKQALIDTVKRLNREVQRLDTFKKSLLSQLQDDDGQYEEAAGSDIAHDVEGARLVEGVLQNVNSMSIAQRNIDTTGHSGPLSMAQTPTHDGKEEEKPLVSKVDGKEFFKGARARLSYEQFSAFLTVIKDLNGGKASKDESLAHARGIFGEQNDDLYEAFENMLSRHIQVG